MAGKHDPGSWNVSTWEHQRTRTASRTISGCSGGTFVFQSHCTRPLRTVGLCRALHHGNPGVSWVLAASLRITTDSASSALCGTPHKAEFERSLIQERTQAGLAAARRAGRTGGRPPKLTDDDTTTLRPPRRCWPIPTSASLKSRTASASLPRRSIATSRPRDPRTCPADKGLGLSRYSFWWVMSGPRSRRLNSRTSSAFP